MKHSRNHKFNFVLFLSIFNQIILSHAGVQAQNGPGGITEINSSSELQLWLDASQIEDVYNLNNLTKWEDVSGKGNHASNNISSSKPNYIESAVNGFSAVKFDGFAEFMQGTINGGLSAPSTLIAVAYFDDLHQSSGINSYLISVGSGGGSRQHTSISRRRPNSGNGDRYYSWDNQAARLGDTILGQQWNIITQYNNSSSPYHQAFINGEASTPTEDYLGPIATNSTYMLGRWYFGSNTWLDGSIAEVILFSKELSELERNILHAYLAAKYNCSITVDFYNGDDPIRGNNDRDVVGIGVELDSNVAATSKGLKLSIDDGFENGDYILFGHAQEQNDLDQIDVNGTIEERWHRAWYLDITNSSSNQKVHFEFDLIKGEIGYGGLNSFNKSDYKLIYRSGTTGNWSIVADASGISRNKVIFNNIELSNDGFYTLGTIDKTNSSIGAGLISSGDLGPGGVGTDDGNSNLKIWYKVPDISGDDGDEVIFLEDESGNENHVQQTTVLNIPSLDAQVVNGLNAVTFNGANSYLAGTLQDGGLNAPLTVFSIGFFNNINQANDDNDYLFSIGKGLARNDQLSVSRRKANDEDNLGNINKYYSWDGDTARYGNKLDGQEWYLFNQRFHTNASSVQFSTQINGVEVSVVDYEAEVSTSNEISIGRWNSNEHWLDGSFAELILFDRELNLAEETIITEYLSAKYNIPIPSQYYLGDSSRFADHDRDVIGIGTEADGNNSSASSAGLRLEQVSGFEAGDYVFAGHSEEKKAVDYLDAVDNTGEVVGRWSRDWYFDITDASNNMSINVVFDFGDAKRGEFPGSLDNVYYKLLYRPDTNGTWTSLVFGASIEGDQVVFNNVSSLEDGFYALGSTNITASPLPIILNNFSAVKRGGRNHLKWETSSEFNNDYFLIQRKTENTNFETIGKVKGSGNSNQRKSYFFDDFYPPDAANIYYQLKQVDYDGKFTYYGPRVVSNIKQKELHIYPNPAKDYLIIDGINYGSKVSLIDSKGVLQWELEYSESESYTIPVTEFQKGVYFLKVESDLSDNTTLKLVIL